eukprot:jgi/Ulvmu1/10141/UM006_0095.1
MDTAVNEKNVSLYNKHAKTDINTHETLQKREKGMAAPLKKLHNRIKRTLLQRFASDAHRLLDLACGRGGDLHKWLDCRIQYVRGYDIAEGEIEEAKARFESILNDPSEKNSRYAEAARAMKVDFVCTHDIGDKVWAAGPLYDCVSCMFALHYFFHSKETARKTVEMAAKNLKEGGHFIGVLPNGRHVMDTIGPEMKPLTMKAMKLAPKWLGQAQSFGSPYTCALTDTVTEGGDDGSGSYEYLVFQKVLVDIAQNYDLHPVTDYDDFELDEVLEPAETSKGGTRLFRRFKPNFPGSHPSLIVASRLNCAFVLRKGKLDDAPAAAAPAADVGVKRARVEEPGVGSGVREGGVGGAQTESKYKRSSKFARAR